MDRLSDMNLEGVVSFLHLTCIVGLVKGAIKAGLWCQFSLVLQTRGLGLQSVQSIAIIIHVILMRFFFERYSKTLM